MERDGLMANGASFLLRDRLDIASDFHVMHVCQSCGSLLNTVMTKTGPIEIIFMVCEDVKRKILVHKVALPSSFKYLVN